MQQNELFTKAQQGDLQSQYTLGCNYLRNGMQTGKESDVTEGIRWLEVAADNGSHGAMVNLAQWYPKFYNTDKTAYVFQRLTKFVESGNPAAMIEVGRICLGSEPDNPYLQKFDMASYLNHELGVKLIMQGVEINRENNMNRLDSQHYYSAFCAYQYHSRKTRARFGSGETTMLEISCWNFIKKALKWAQDNGMPKEYLDLYETTEKATREYLHSQPGFRESIKKYEEAFGKI